MPPKVKLLKFVNGDAPQTLAGAELSHTRLEFGSKAAHASLAKAWTLKSSEEEKASLRGGYWLLDENNKPVALVDEVILAVPEEASGKDGKTTTCSSTPRGVTDEDIRGVDLRSKLGRQLERARAEYGTTYRTASKSAREMMNAEEVMKKRSEKMKREREAVADAVEAGEALPHKRPGRRVQTES